MIRQFDGFRRRRHATDHETIQVGEVRNEFAGDEEVGDGKRVALFLRGQADEVLRTRRAADGVGNHAGSLAKNTAPEKILRDDPDKFHVKQNRRERRHLAGEIALNAAGSQRSRCGLHPQKKSTEIDFDVEGRHILLVDDVIYTGRSIRAALNELFDFGRPASVKLACLVDRGGRALPFSADYLGLTMNLPSIEELALVKDSISGNLHFDIHTKLPQNN